MSREERNTLRKVLFDKIRDHHGMYAAFSSDGIHWILDDRNCVPRSGDAGTFVYDPMHQRYMAVSRRYESLTDHFVLEWKQWRRVIALSTSKDFVHWTPLKTILKPDDFDDPVDQFYVMTPFVYGSQYIGFIGLLHSATELGPVQLATARDIGHWHRVGRREEFLPVGSPGAWDGAWSSLSSNPPALIGDTLYMWYSGRPQAHGTEGRFTSSIGMVTLRKDGFVAFRCGIRGGELMTEPVEVKGPRLSVNATCCSAEYRSASSTTSEYRRDTTSPIVTDSSARTRRTSRSPGARSSEISRHLSERKFASTYRPTMPPVCSPTASAKASLDHRGNRILTLQLPTEGD